LIIELKSRFDGDPRIAQSSGALVAAYTGPAAIKSFDPEPLHVLRSASLTCPIGIISEARYDHAEWAHLSSAKKAALIDFSFYSEIKPDFLSWCANDLPHAVPRLCREAAGMPVMAWTIRSPQECARIAPWTDQIIFEGFAA
jgi:glycerophosphoryl diester phosphodiesterase